ncbi:hypothetical protein P43SY_007809 [Pythium insidiosum]|uniref:PCI domain-containing protein n=1 Tax=Pythium insidiosum TaxID=114742 RepID=A0AAD5Q2M7_PYTIN|nr:hypothetical protein P43SY_007809 [Pythium insidiosum]
MSPMDSTMAPTPQHLEGFDVESYASKYTGRNRINRLLFVAKQSAALRHDALDLLLQELASSKNMKLYLEVAEAATNEPSNIPERALSIDQTHVESVKRATAQQHERLEQELNSYKSTMIKESIRMGYNDLGNFFYELGDLPAALKSFAQARDYCTADKHVVEMCLNVSKVGLHMRNFGLVKSYLTKLEQIEMARNDPILKTKLSSAFGLVALHEKNYREAALKFVECQVDVGATYNEVLHAEDIALYGGICALASFQRSELREKVINNAGFKAFLELLPWLRELINDFYSSNYATCLQSLEMMKSEMRLDMYLAEHVDALCQEIRSRGIVQFFYPYLSVDLRQMAKTFNTPVDALETEVCALIVAGKIDARMDSYEKVLYAYHPNKRRATYQRAFDVGRKYAAESRNLMLRMSLLKNNLVVRDV